MTDIRKIAGPILPAAAVIIVFVVYSMTLLPGVGYSGDTSKFQFVGKVLGTPHEPGSPTYVMLNFIWVNLFPFGSIGFRANLLSAVFSALALFTTSRLLTILGVRNWIAATVVLIFGFTYTLWSQSVIAEVYSLSILFNSLTFYLFIRWKLEGKYRDFLLGCAVYAASFGDHLIVVTILPAIAYLVWTTHKEFFWTPRVIFHVLLLIALGAAQYGYLFWRYYAHETSYLEILVPDIKALLFYTTGGQFQPNFLALGWRGVLFERLPLLLRFLWLEFLLLGPIGLIGLAVLRSSGVRNFLLIALGGTFLFDLIYVVPDIFIYMMPVYLVVTVGLGLGLEWFTVKVGPGRETKLGTVLALLPVCFLALNYARADQSKSIDARRLVEESLQVAGTNALIICPNYDYAENFWYYAFVDRDTADHLFVLYSHEGALPFREIESYIDRGEPFELPLQRRFTPAGLTIYYSAACQARPFDLGRMRYPQSEPLLARYRESFVFQPMYRFIDDGFALVPVGRDLYRLERTHR
jgi:hypothetical protein